MSPAELEIQRRGYVAALTDDRVIKAIEQGVHGKVAITYFEWAGATTQHLVVPWTVIASREDAERIAAQLSANPPKSARRTSMQAHWNSALTSSPRAGSAARSGNRHFRRWVEQPGPPVEIAR